MSRFQQIMEKQNMTEGELRELHLKSRQEEVEENEKFTLAKCGGKIPKIRKKCSHCGKFITGIVANKCRHAYRDDGWRCADEKELYARGLLDIVDYSEKDSPKRHAQVSDFAKRFRELISGGGAWLNADKKIIGVRTDDINHTPENYHLDCVYEALAEKYPNPKDFKSWHEYKSWKNEYMCLHFQWNAVDFGGGKENIKKHLAARKIQRWFRRDVRHKLSDPKHPAGFAVMIRGMEEVGMDEVEIAALKLEFKMKRQHKQVKDFFKSMEKSGKKVAKQVAKTK